MEFSIEIHPSPYNNTRVEEGLRLFCSRSWSIPQWGSACIYKGIFSGTEEELYNHLKGIVFPGLDDVFYWERPTAVYYTLRRHWDGKQDVSTTGFVLRPDDIEPESPCNYFPEGEKESFHNAAETILAAYPLAVGLNDDYFYCECMERTQHR